MTPFIIIAAVVFVCSFLITRAKVRRKGDIALTCILINGAISTWIAIQALQGRPFDERFYGGSVFGEVFIRVDALSAWFILLMNFSLAAANPLSLNDNIKNQIALYPNPVTDRLHLTSPSEFYNADIHTLYQMLFKSLP